MKIKNIRSLAINTIIIFLATVLVFILGASGLILKDEKNSILDDMRLRTEIFSKTAATVLFPEKNIFMLVHN